MKATTLKGKIRAVEREISNVNTIIEEKRESLARMTKGTRIEQVYTNSLTKEELSELILSGAELYTNNYHGGIYLYKEVPESDEEFNRRVECQVKSIAGLEAKKEELKVSLTDLKELKRKEEEIYKNPEYIQYLKLKKQFEDE